jgi:hypothetical protein
MVCQHFFRGCPNPPQGFPILCNAEINPFSLDLVQRVPLCAEYPLHKILFVFFGPHVGTLNISVDKFRDLPLNLYQLLKLMALHIAP